MSELYGIPLETAFSEGIASRHWQARCLHCDEPLVWGHGRGWCHLTRHGDLGGGYIMRCDACGWRNAPRTPPARCPHCGDPAVRDDHAALAI